METNKKERINVYVTKDLKDYVEEQARLYNMSISSYFSMCVIEKKNLLDNLDVMQRFMNELPALQQLRLEDERRR